MDGHFIDLYVHHKNENIWKKSHKLKKKKKKSCKSLQNIYWVSQSLSKVVSQISTISAKKKKKGHDRRLNASQKAEKQPCLNPLILAQTALCLQVNNLIFTYSVAH